jgi:hypothetical protein
MHAAGIIQSVVGLYVTNLANWELIASEHNNNEQAIIK